MDDAQRWQPPRSRDKNTARREGEREGPDPRQKSPERAGTAGKAGERTERTNRTQAGPTTKAKGRRAASKGRRRSEANRRTERQTDDNDTTASEQTNEGEAGTPEADSADSAQDHLSVA